MSVCKTGALFKRKKILTKILIKLLIGKETYYYKLTTYLFLEFFIVTFDKIFVRIFFRTFGRILNWVPAEQQPENFQTLPVSVSE